MICKSRSLAESGNSVSVSWLSLQCSIGDQGALAKLELRLSIITILQELMNMLNYTARNILVYQEAKVWFFLIWETFSFQISMSACFLRKYQGRCKSKIWPPLPCIPVDQPSTAALVLQVLRQQNRSEKHLSTQRDVFCIF